MQAVFKTFNRSQPRWPKGTERGGQWRDTGAATPEALLDFEGRIRNYIVEQSGVFDSEGNQYGMEVGTQSSVSYDLPDGIVEETFIVTHNHPNEGLPFSYADIRQFVSSGIQEMRAVGAQNTYSMKWKLEKRPESGRPYGMFYKPDRMDEYRELELLHAQERTRLIMQVGRRTISVEEKTDLMSGMWERIADQLGMEYRRERR